jgi:nitronate monooxygenase
MFDLRSLARPIVGAPMAGGPSTPALAAAISDTGGLGFLAAGYKTADQVADELTATRELTSGPIGLNLFVVTANAPNPDSLAAYRRELAPEAVRYGVELGTPLFDDDDWKAKVAVVAELKPDVVTFTFGCPSTETIARLHRAGITTGATVTTSREAVIAADRGVKTLIVQGSAAGGHRGTFDVGMSSSREALDALLAAVRSRTVLPIVAGGGVSGAHQAEALLRGGAQAVQIGTALLLADEAGTNPTHRMALSDPQFTTTALTNAFTGRWARGLVNRFMREHPLAPPAYPQVHHLTSPIRRAAAAAGDPNGLHLWAGTGYRLARPDTAAQIVEDITP